MGNTVMINGDIDRHRDDPHEGHVRGSSLIHLPRDEPFETPEEKGGAASIPLDCAPGITMKTRHTVFIPPL